MGRVWEGCGKGVGRAWERVGKRVLGKVWCRKSPIVHWALNKMAKEAEG